MPYAATRRDEEPSSSHGLGGPAAGRPQTLEPDPTVDLSALLGPSGSGASPPSRANLLAVLGDREEEEAEDVDVSRCFLEVVRQVCAMGRGHGLLIQRELAMRCSGSQHEAFVRVLSALLCLSQC